MNERVHRTLEFVGCAVLAFLGLGLVARGEGNPWGVFAGFSSLGIAVLTWTAHRGGHEFELFPRFGALAGHALLWRVLCTVLPGVDGQ
jgi:hypothetical protein